MKVIPTYREFLNTVIPVYDYEWDDIGIEPDSITGIFDSHRLDELIEFCGRNPDYHIVSIRDGCLYFNKVVYGASMFQLAIGDSNPSIVCFEHYKLAKI